MANSTERPISSLLSAGEGSLRKQLGSGCAGWPRMREPKGVMNQRHKVRLLRLRRLVVLVAFGLTAVVGGVADAGASVIAGHNGKIVVGQVFPNIGFTINPNGAERHSVGPPGSTTCVGWSPNGEKVLCNLWGTDHVQPATANPDGSDFRLLDPRRKLDLFCLSWSPTGTRLLCHSEGMQNPAQAGLYSIRASDGRDLERLSATPSGHFDNGYGFSPDGSRVLYGRFNFNSSSDNALFSVRRNGTGKVRLSPRRLNLIDLGFFDRVEADWSPHGSQVVFAAFIPSLGKTGLFVVDRNGTELHRITPPSVGAISAQWSPRGNLITFTSCCQRIQVFVVHASGHDLRQLTYALNGSQSFTPVWSPNGHEVLFQREFFKGSTPTGGALYRVTRKGRDLDRVTTLPTFVFAQGGAFFYSWGTASP
ncbi:MAG: TolB protein [Actinomycetota bacterium]|nr:TolB protein [Actinomycetota bacterium]